MPVLFVLFCVAKKQIGKEKKRMTPKTIKNRVPVSVGIPFDLLAKVDEKANENNASRSDYVVQALREKIQRDENKQ